MDKSHAHCFHDNDQGAGRPGKPTAQKGEVVSFPHGEKQSVMIIKCCVCGRIRSDFGWIQENLVDMSSDRVSHGYCPQCAEQAFAMIRQFHEADEERQGTGE